MTGNPPALRDLEALFRRQICDCWKGTVGDGGHDNGYHRGGYEVPVDDYSAVSPRDVEGIREYGGYWASAVDPGMEWPASRQWFVWLIAQARALRFPDVAEIIGSADGVQDYRYISDDGFQFAELWYGNHIEHSHISFFRDAIFRSQNYLFDTWTSTGRVPPKGTTAVVPKHTPVIQTTTPNPTPSPWPTKPQQPSGVSLGGTFLLCAAGGVAWFLKRRMELTREDT